jgi:hypothetical protein
MFEVFHSRLFERGGLSPEADFAGREARFADYDATEKEGAHGGTMGSPML